MTAPTQGAVATRADAQRNHAHLLEVAAAAFASDGIDVPAEEIARRAGVAKGTLFRHFPSKGELLSAVLQERISGMRRLVLEIAEGCEPGFDALAELMMRAGAMLAADRSFFDAAMCEAQLDGPLAREKLELEAALANLLTRCQASGEVRGDVVGADVAMLIMAATNTCAPSHERSPELWRRYVTLMIDGLRPDATTPLPVAPFDAAFRA
jgi:AcrR family transcriptional regulator